MDPPLRPPPHVSPYITTSTQDFSSRQKLDSQSHTSHTTFPSNLRKGLEGRVKNEYSTMSKMAGAAWDESNDIMSQRTTRLQIELAECVETKTVTTTTTTKRSYPPLLIQPPRSLESLDAKEYPLALKPTPYKLTNFSYKVNGEVVHFREDPLQTEVRPPLYILYYVS
jgi:F-box and WD-40 domain protein CDC4